MSEQDSKIDTVFDSEEQHVGQVYAKALLQAAASSRKVDTVVDQLSSLVKDILDKNEGFDLALSNPKMSVENKISFLDRVFGSKLDVTLLNFLKVLCRRHRIQYLRAIAKSASAQLDDMADRVQVQVTTSAPLDSKSEQNLIVKLKSMFKKDVRLITRVDPNIVGGLIVRIGDTVFDGSIDGQLKVLRRELSTKAEAAIRGQTAQLIQN